VTFRQSGNRQAVEEVLKSIQVDNRYNGAHSEGSDVLHKLELEILQVYLQNSSSRGMLTHQEPICAYKHCNCVIHTHASFVCVGEQDFLQVDTEQTAGGFKTKTTVRHTRTS